MKVKVFYVRETLSKYETLRIYQWSTTKQCVISKNYTFQLEKSFGSIILRKTLRLHRFCNYLLIILILIPFNYAVVRVTRQLYVILPRILCLLLNKLSSVLILNGNIIQYTGCVYYSLLTQLLGILKMSLLLAETLSYVLINERSLVN